MDGPSTPLVGKIYPIVLRRRGMYVCVNNAGCFFPPCDSITVLPLTFTHAFV